MADTAPVKQGKKCLAASQLWVVVTRWWVCPGRLVVQSTNGHIPTDISRHIGEAAVRQTLPDRRFTARGAKGSVGTGNPAREASSKSCVSRGADAHVQALS